MNRFILIFIFSLLNGSLSFATAGGNSAKYRVDTIQITGNKITEDYIILNELTFSKGAYIDSSDISYNRERIYSLGLFNQVTLIPLEDKNSLQIHVEESWYIWPVPFLELQDRDWSKISYGMDFQIKNFMGRNEFLRLKTSFGYSPGLRVQYAIPYLSRKENIFADFQAGYGTFRNVSLDAQSRYGGRFYIDYINAYATIGKRFGLYKWLSGYLSYENYKYPSSQTKPDFKYENYGLFGTGISFRYDTRNLVQFPTMGSYFLISDTYKGIGSKDYTYQRVNCDYREYIPLSENITLKARANTTALVGGKYPFHDAAYIGLSDRVRGNFTVQQEGDFALITSLEANYPILKEWLVKFNYPYLPEQLQSFRTALYHHFFIDAAHTKRPGNKLTLNGGLIGYGTGLSFIVLPYRVFTLEIAFNDKGKSEYIFQMDVSF